MIPVAVDTSTEKPRIRRSTARVSIRVPPAGTTEQRGERLVRFLANRNPAVLFKHSPACFVSRRALSEVRAFAAARPEVTVILVDVLAERDLSRWIAARWDVPHQSPQALVFRCGRVAWHASHGSVEAARLEIETRDADAGVVQAPG